MSSPHSARKGLLIGAAIVASLAAVAVLTGSEPNARASGPGKTAPAAAAVRPAQNSCSVCLERNPLLNPARFNGWNDADVKASYEAAIRYPDLIDKIHCFCECKESAREQHKTLLTCFTTQHAAGCGICQHEAILAAKLKDQGVSDDEVESTVERLHRTEGHAPTKGRGI